ncbi:ABC transporter permease [Vibrio gazogenes]|uniref:ABC-type spermidine/putrescine transport system, permease component I n=1 Tax=Vibrio gazogenes DSM 21264 = NBRC 103151 TaxID=1123492 RepID=A0A1M5G0C8_VIBGA|nr:sugar ABC transporter permease [Vibrio gazogenes]USP14724.1 sugar ABC transporter permease [Vibrio gazogenes]SHF97250.1 ABC-type spermidine/putrescine transport system, permease component I [Vibrio gazogenes DSM 21264] [Vibrio gazogenes DSM 21264 = NBRC 103151]
MRYSSLKSLWLVMPAAIMVALFFLYPLCFSLFSALMNDDGSFTTAHLQKALELYSNDMIFTIVIVLSSMVVLCLLSITIAAILRLSPFKPVVRVLDVLYKFPLFIPLIVTAQIMRTFLAKNGLMNNTLIELGMFSPLESVSFLGWKGIIITFVWKQLAFSTLLISGAMAAIDESQVRASRNLGGSRIRTLFEIILPQVLPTIGVAMVLSVVTMMSALSVPLMIGTGTPTMITADMAFRINSYGDYHVANMLGLISYCICAAFAWFYLRQSIKDKGAA